MLKKPKATAKAAPVKAPKIPHYGVIAEAPLSETLIPKVKTGTREECIADLRSLAIANPTQVISRNYYRVHGKFAESCYTAWSGSFEEFKRQAGLKLTRQQHAVERAVARHASVDHYRKLNNERRDYASNYERPNANRFKTIIFCSDLHDKEMDPFYRRVLIDTIKRVKPDVFSLVGDGLDLPEFGKYGVDPREWDVTGRIKHMHKFLEDIREVAPDLQIDWLEGNHEFRLLRHLADQTPALRAVLSDLHGMTVRQLLGLDTYEVNYIAKADLAAFNQADLKKEIGKNYKVYYDTVLAYHFPDGKSMGLPGVNGHHHRHVVWSEFSPIYGAYEWHQMGCGHKRDASYCNGEKWHMGFAIANIDTQTRQVNFDYVPITDMAVSGGKWYHREETELAGLEFRIGLSSSFQVDKLSHH